MGIFKQAKKIIAAVENPDIPFLYYILLFLSSVTLRNFLEIFSDRAKIAFKLFPAQNILYCFAWKGLSISLLHYYVFWTALVLAIGILFLVLTREDINKILRAVLSFSFLLNNTPIFDLIITGGKGLDIAYAHPKNILEFLPLPSNLTPGMKLTGIAAFALSFIYCKIKTNSIKKGLLGALGLYLMLLAGSLLPLFLKASHPLPIIRFLLILIFFELVALFYWRNKDYFLVLIKDIRWLRILYFYSMLIFGILLSRQPFIKILSQNLSAFLLTLLSISFCWVSAIMFNNLEDCSIDKISNARRPLVAKSIPKETYKKTAVLTFCAAAVFGLGVNFQTFFFALLLTGNSFLYSLPPLRLKRIPIFSKLLISFNSLILIMLGYIFAGEEILRFPAIITWYFLIFITLAMNFIDLKDYEGDKQAGILTLPVMFGLKRAKLIIGGFVLISYCILSLVLLDLRLFIPGLFLGGLQFFFINQRHYKEKRVLLTYIVSILFLLIYLTF